MRLIVANASFTRSHNLITFIVKEKLQNAIPHLGEVKYQNNRLKSNFFDVHETDLM